MTKDERIKALEDENRQLVAVIKKLRHEFEITTKAFGLPYNRLLHEIGRSDT